MSAGVCILTKESVVLAADSAITVKNSAVYNTGNKLFSLSRTEPIGAIIYSNVTLMGVPLEVIIKEYKAKLENKVFDKTSDYLNDFIEFIENQASFFLFSEVEEEYVISICENAITEIINKRKYNTSLSYADLISNISSKIDASNKVIERGESFSNYIRSKYKKGISQIIETNMPDIDDNSKELMIDCICKAFDHICFDDSFTGLLITGFGKNEIFPKAEHVFLFGVLGGKLRYEIIGTELHAGNDCPAMLLPLAQIGTMQSFIRGISPELIDSVTKGIANDIKSKNKIDIDQSSIKSVINQISIEQYSRPMLNTLGFLPKEELASLAESLINITSIRRKILIDDNNQTVGGPIDVAILTRGDGFIWVKRKHYFDKEHNPQFFATKYANNINGDF